MADDDDVLLPEAADREAVLERFMVEKGLR